MIVRIYRSTSNAGLFAFTSEETGGNLPSVLGPWNFAKALDIRRGDRRAGVDSDAVLSEIDVQGYALSGPATMFDPLKFGL